MEGVIVASSLVVTMIYENAGTVSGEEDSEDGLVGEDDGACKARNTCWNLTVPPPFNPFPVTSIPSVFTIS